MYIHENMSILKMFISLSTIPTIKIVGCW